MPQTFPPFEGIGKEFADLRQIFAQRVHYTRVLQKAWHTSVLSVYFKGLFLCSYVWST